LLRRQFGAKLAIQNVYRRGVAASALFLSFSSEVAVDKNVARAVRFSFASWKSRL